MSDARGPFYMRQSRSGDWSKVSESSPEDGTFPADVIADIINLVCQTSVWQVESLDAPEVNYLVAGLVSRNATAFQEMKFRFISEGRLKSFGLRKFQTTGECLDRDLNKSGKHWVIETPTLRDAIIFAKGLIHEEVKFCSKTEVMQQFMQSIQSRRIQIKAFRHELWAHLIDEGHIQGVINPSANPSMSFLHHLREMLPWR